MFQDPNDVKPSYLKLAESGELSRRISVATDMMKSCHLCPRRCGVNRLENETGFCRTGRRARVASFDAHFGEEAPLVGKFGSGTIFIASCNLMCMFCQNYEISHLSEGIEVGPEQMARMMTRLQEMGCHNINFVTPTHVVPQILESLLPAVDNGFKLPLVYNCGGYERVETLRLLEDIFDIYMPDFKFWDDKWALRYCEAPGYRQYAIDAVKEMHRQVGDLKVDEAGLAETGLIVRHLVMPNGISGSRYVADFIAEEISVDTYLNVMDQYRPCGRAGEDEYIDRRLRPYEFRDAVAAAAEAGLKRLDPRERQQIIFRFR